jgi:hypothetical protein
MNSGLAIMNVYTSWWPAASLGEGKPTGYLERLLGFSQRRAVVGSEESGP